MSKFRRAAKIDANQPEIVEALRKIPGVSVEVGHDDIIVGLRNQTFWYEIKEPDAVSKRTGEVKPSQIKPSQKKLQESFTGHYRIVWTLDQILDELFPERVA